MQIFRQHSVPQKNPAGPVPAGKSLLRFFSSKSSPALLLPAAVPLIFFPSSPSQLLLFLSLITSPPLTSAVLNDVWQVQEVSPGREGANEHAQVQATEALALGKVKGSTGWPTGQKKKIVLSL